MRTLIALTGALSALAPSAFAQAGQRGGERGPDGGYRRLYDMGTVTTLKGEIEKVERIAPMGGVSAGIHLVLKTDKESLSVHLGPEWFISSQEPKLAARDVVEVTGSRITLDGRPVVIAAAVTKGAKVLKLRDERGVPVWGGGRRRR